MAQRSWVWKYAEKKSDRAFCKLCEDNIGFACPGGTTGSLGRHLKNVHKIMPSTSESANSSGQMKSISNISSPTPSSASDPQKGKSRKRHCSYQGRENPCTPDQTDKIHQALTKMMVENTLPLSFCTSEGFKQFMAVVEPNYKIHTLCVPALEEGTAEESFSPPATQCSSDSSHVSTHFFNYEAPKKNAEVISTPISNKEKRIPSHSLACPQNLQEPALMNDIPAKDRWKMVFSEYILCELDRYEYHDAQKLKNQLTMVCLNFQPTNKIIENGEKVNETELMICKIEENVEADNENIVEVEKMRGIKAQDFLDFKME